MSDEPRDPQGTGTSDASARERLTRGLRHDLRNPLAVVLGRCEMLMSGANGELEERQLRSVEIIHRNATRMVEMLEELAALAAELPDGGGKRPGGVD